MRRADWVAIANKLARPVLTAAAEERLDEALQASRYAAATASSDRIRTAALEAVGRTLAGIAPWLDAPEPDAPEIGTDEATIRAELADLARTALRVGADPDRRGYLRFRGTEQQTLVDAAFLAQGILRAPDSLWAQLDEYTRGRLQQSMYDLRSRKPHFNNWLLFGAVPEALLYRSGGTADLMRIDYALRQHEQWYLGDGVYGDGPVFHADYYNAYVIHPMIVDTLRAVAGADPEWDAMWEHREVARFRRAAALQERMIAPDGSYPILGRSISYRAGAFQILAQAALLDMLPEGLPAGQVRGALSAVIRRTLVPPRGWRDDGLLEIGVTGPQPSLGEHYITPGSLYLTSCVLLPLGLAPSHPFWRDEELPWTSVRVWNRGEDLPADHAL
jgi:hypothetical protein